MKDVGGIHQYTTDILWHRENLGGLPLCLWYSKRDWIPVSDLTLLPGTLGFALDSSIDPVQTPKYESPKTLGLCGRRIYEDFLTCTEFRNPRVSPCAKSTENTTELYPVNLLGLSISLFPHTRLSGRQLTPGPRQFQVPRVPRINQKVKNEYLKRDMSEILRHNPFLNSVEEETCYK